MCDNPNDYQITSQSIDQQEIVENENQTSNQEDQPTERTVTTDQEKPIIDKNLNNTFKKKENIPKQINQVYEDISDKIGNIHSIVESNLSNIMIDENNLEKISEFKKSINNFIIFIRIIANKPKICHWSNIFNFYFT